MLFLNVNKRIPLVRETESDFVVPILVDVLADVNSDHTISSSSGAKDQVENQEDRPYIVGRLWAECWEFEYSMQCGYSAIRVADSVSATWEDVVGTLMRSGKRFRSDLDIDDYVTDILFLHKFLFHPDMDRPAVALDAILRALTNEASLVLAQYQPGHDKPWQDWEYRELGFKKIAGSSMLLRNCSYRYPLGDTHPAGKSIQIAASSAHESWVLEQWEQLVLDHPEI